METLSDAPEKLSDYVYDGEDRWATPGLIDCHTHLVYAGDRALEFEERLHGKTYADIAKDGGGILATVRATRAASEDDIFAQSAARLKALMREGVTGVEIKSGYGLDTATERKLLRVATRLRDECGVAVQRTFLGAHALPPEFTQKDAYITHVCDEMLPSLAAEGLVDAVDGFCEKIAFSAEQVSWVFDAAAALNLPVKLHAEQLSDSHGAALAARYSALSADHLEYAGEDAAAAMAQSATAAVLLPGAFYTLRETQKPPVGIFRRHDVPMALATDHNPGTSPCLSLLLMMNMGCTFFGLTPEEALAGVTRNAARALGWQKDRGTLETGKAADVALWAIGHPRELAYAFGRNPCAGVILGGGWIPFQEP
jgi:imidazolonepropionase